MATRDQLIKQAEEKWNREQLVTQAEMKWAAENQPEPEFPAMEQVETAGRSMLEGMTLGASEPVISGINAVIGNLIESGFDAESLKDFFVKSVDANQIGKQYESDVARRKAMKEAMPGTAAAGEILGAFSPVGPAATVGRAAVAATKGLKGIPAVGSMAQQAASGALAAGAAAGIEKAAQIPTGFAEPGELPEVSGAAGLGGKIGAAIGALPVVGKAVSAAAPRVMSAMGGVSPKIISEYLKRGEPSQKVSPSQLQDAVEVAAQNVQDALLQNRTQSADDLVAAVSALKNKVSDGSDEAFQILEAASAGNKKAFVPMPAIQKTVNQSINELRRGAEALTPIRESAAGYMENLLERFQTRAVKGRIDLVTAKEMIQAIDEVKKVATSAGQFSSSLDVALGALRKTIDQSLKTQVPEYAAKMLEVADNTRLLGVANDFFGESQKALKNVDRLVIGRDPYLNAAAEKLERATGVQIRKGVESVSELRPVQSVMPDNTNTFVKAVLGGKSPRAQQQLEVLSKFTNENLSQLAENAQLTQIFGSLVQNGSRDVVFWKELLGATAPYVAAGTAFGGPMGAVVGFLVKTYGAPTTKLVLDGMLQVRGIPTVQKINQALANVSEPVRQQLVSGFIQANVMRMDPSEPQVMQLDEAQRVEVYMEIKNSDLDAVTKANAMRSLSQDGTIQTRVMKQYMAGMKAPRQPVRPPIAKGALERDRPDRLRR
jgi:hypothetical protein